MSSQELGKRAVSALGWSYGGAILRAISQLVVQVLLARLLGPESFGQAMAAFLVLGIGWLLAEGGFGAALVQKAKLDEGDVSYALGWVLLLSCSAALLVVLASPWLAIWLGSAELRNLIAVSGALIPLQAISNVSASLMRRNLDAKRSQLIFLASYIGAYGVTGLSLAWAGAGPWSLVVAYGLQSLLSFAGCYAIVQHTLRPRLSGDNGLRRFGLQVTGTNAANWAIENLDRVLVNRFWGITALGEYTAASNLSRAPAGLLVNSLSSVAFASASRIQADLPRLARAYLALLNLVGLVALPMFVLLAMHADAVVHLLYGERWLQAGPLFAAFCISIPFFMVLYVTGPFLWAVDAVRPELVIQVAAAGLILIGFLMLSDYPLAQAVWWVPCVYAFRAFWVLTAVTSRLKTNWRSVARQLAGGIALALLSVIVSLACSRILSPLSSAIVSGVVCLVLSFTIFIAAPRWLLANEMSGFFESMALRSGPLAAVLRWISIKSRRQ